MRLGTRADGSNRVCNPFRSLCQIRSHQRVRDASRMGKVFRPRAGHIRQRSVHRMFDRHAGPDTELEVSQCRPDERFQRRRVERVHGAGQRQTSDRVKLGLLGQSVGRMSLQVFVPVRSSAAGAVSSGHAEHHRPAVEHGPAGSQQYHVNINANVYSKNGSWLFLYFILRTEFNDSWTNDV